MFLLHSALPQKMCWCIRRENFIETHSQTIKISIGDNTWPQKPFLGSTVKDVVLPGSTKISDPGSRVRLAESPAYMCRPLEGVDVVEFVAVSADQPPATIEVN